MLAISIFTATAEAAFGAKPQFPKRFPEPPSFEEESPFRGGEARFVWRQSGVTASFSSGAVWRIGSADASALRVSFGGANEASQPEGERVTPRRSFYYRGPPATWRVSRHFERVRYREVYPGIDVVFITRGERLEYNFEIAPNADPAAIRVLYEGALVSLHRGGHLSIRGPGMRLTQRRARAYLTGGPAISCRYRVVGHREVRIEIGNYARERGLLIDPVLNFSTYLGGASFDAINAAAADAAGNLYVAGETSSGSLPGGQGANRSSRDAFVAKLNSSASQVLYIAYLGGSGNDAARGIAVDGPGNAYITGVTGSSDFPVTTGAFSTHNSGVEDAFVSKLDGSGNLVYSTYLGGEKADSGFAMAVDGSGAAYVAGQTASPSFPVTGGAMQATNRGGMSDCFVSKLNPAGNALSYSTFLGGSGLDLCRGIAVDAWGNAYVTGTTYSSDFPVRAPLQSALQGTANAFVAMIQPSGTALVYSTFLGGSTMDDGNAIVVDGAGAAYVAGDTASPDFPVTAGAAQAVLKGAYNAFAAKVSPGGSALAYATYVGGSGSDAAMAIALDVSGKAVLGGYTSSTDFPLVDAVQNRAQGSFDAFAAALDTAGASLVFSSYFGGTGDDRASAVAALPGNKIFVAGMTASSSFPVLGGVQSSAAGNYDAFTLEATYISGLLFVPLTPCRVADTRTFGGKTGAFGPPYMAGGSTRVFPLPSSSCGIPASSQAYSLNITALPINRFLVFLTVWPSGAAFPTVSTLNSWDGRWVANAAIVPAGASGAISIYVSDDTDLIIDINGYFDSPTNAQGLALYTVTPCRIADTRGDQGKTGAFGPPYLSHASSRVFPLPFGPCTGIPASAAAYSLNITAFPRRGTLVFLSAWPAGQPFPVVSTLNSITGIVVANAAIVPAGSGGGVTLYVSDEADVIIDINGYFAPSGNPGALYFHTAVPCRIADTRSDQGKTGPFGPPSIAGGAYRSIPAPQSTCRVPVAAQAYSLNITALPPAALGWVTVWPAGQPEPIVSTLNDWSGTVVANAAIVPAGIGGGINIFVSDTTDIIVDINGYFAP